jgi:hypothetical protein
MEIVKQKWRCTIHGIECSLLHPCYECKKEVQNPNIIENDKQEFHDLREKNARPRIRL